MREFTHKDIKIKFEKSWSSYKKMDFIYEKIKKLKKGERILKERLEETQAQMGPLLKSDDRDRDGLKDDSSIPSKSDLQNQHKKKKEPSYPSLINKTKGGQKGKSSQKIKIVSLFWGEDKNFRDKSKPLGQGDGTASFGGKGKKLFSTYGKEVVEKNIKLFDLSALLFSDSSNHRSDFSDQVKIKSKDKGKDKDGQYDPNDGRGPGIPKLILGIGKNAKGNDFLRKNWASAEDYWFHLEGYKSTHAIVNRSSLSDLSNFIIEVIASLMVDHSSLKISEIPLIMTQVKNLKGLKGVAGSVRYKKEKYRVVSYIKEEDRLLS